MISTLCGGRIIDIYDRRVDEGIQHHPDATLAAPPRALSEGPKDDKRHAQRTWMTQFQDAETIATDKVMPLWLRPRGEIGTCAKEVRCYNGDGSSGMNAFRLGVANCFGAPGDRRWSTSGSIRVNTLPEQKIKPCANKRQPSGDTT
jgi:hypothetical protein